MNPTRTARVQTITAAAIDITPYQSHVRRTHFHHRHSNDRYPLYPSHRPPHLCKRAAATIDIVQIHQSCRERRKTKSSDDPQSVDPRVVTVQPDEVAATPDPEIDVLEVVDAIPPSLVDPEMLVNGLRFLQQRIPEFIQMSVQEKRSHARAANLDPEFLESGLHAAAMWPHPERFVKRSGEELRKEDEVIRRWNEAIRAMRAVLDGLEAANRKAPTIRLKLLVPPSLVLHGRSVHKTPGSSRRNSSPQFQCCAHG
ncbi:MAG TPA: hypothetical protein VGQ76_27475 [Thermoanaerobaculia bacterium]|jgi:hypothetical protein|nr:hypothetical protein [Thermoanaerobaculia bacterium]